MVKLDKKMEIIYLHLRDGKSGRQISKITGISRDTVRKYINEYDKKTIEATECTDEQKVKMIIGEIVNAPKYHSNNRKKVKLTDEVKEKIDEMLKENEEKRITGRRKNVKKKIDIYESLIDSDFDIGYTTVCNYVSTIENKKEAYIRQQYDLGETIEFDWGDVRLIIGGRIKSFSMGLLTTAKGFNNFARLYHNKKMENFLDIHVKCIDYMGGVHKEFVYDNLKQAVRRFVGPNEKEATEDLKKLSMYYGFRYRFCNCRKGNEKGTVERGVEFVRRKVFSKKDNFETFEEAQKFLVTQLHILNSKEKSALENKSPNDILNEEKKYLLPLKPSYDVSRRRECRVDKYSVVTIDSNKYSVPDYLVGKFVMAKIYSEAIVLMFKDVIVAQHSRSYKNHDWVINIIHYTRTLKKKPGSLHSSAARRQLDPRLQSIYKTYYINKPKEFIVLLEIIEKNSLEKVLEIVDELSKIKHSTINTENIRNLVNKAPEEPERTVVDASIDNASKELIIQINSLFSIVNKGGMVS